MTAWSDPPRLLDGTALSDEDRAALSAYAAEAPGVARRARMLEGLAHELASRTDLAPLGSAARFGAGRLKLVLGAAGLLASAIGLFVLWPRHTSQPAAHSPLAAQVAPPSHFAARVAAVEPATPASLPEPAARTESPAAATSSASPAVPRERTASSRPPLARAPKGGLRGGESTASAPSKTSLGLDLPTGPESEALQRRADPVAELALLARARRALLTRPAHALEFTEAHARKFPHGTFGEEREVLAIEALLRLGLSDEAKQRAIAFERLFPDSAHRAHLARMIQPPAP